MAAVKSNIPAGVSVDFAPGTTGDDGDKMPTWFHPSVCWEELHHESASVTEPKTVPSQRHVFQLFLKMTEIHLQSTTLLINSIDLCSKVRRKIR